MNRPWFYFGVVVSMRQCASRISRTVESPSSREIDMLLSAAVEARALDGSQDEVVQVGQEFSLTCYARFGRPLQIIREALKRATGHST